jgi:transcriptional regulator with GAF, ATPase, and Fis domain
MWMALTAFLWFDPSLSAEDSKKIAEALGSAGVEPARESGWRFGAAFHGGGIESALAAVERLAATRPDRLIAVAACADALDDVDAWRLLGAGAADVIAWARASNPAQEIAARFARWAEIDELVMSDRVSGTLVGRSPAMRSALRDIVEAARFSDSNILLTGETGSGKELAARLVHDLDPRRPKGPFVTVDCTTIVPTLAGSEFFGHERGAFTGAVASRDGAFAQADGGTLFLDEVGELPPPLQAELLRVVQEGTYKRVGGNTWRETRFRLISATHRDLNEEAAAGRFRYDFLFRIASWRCRLPPMHERREDVPALAHHFLRQLGMPAPPWIRRCRGIWPTANTPATSASSSI